MNVNETLKGGLQYGYCRCCLDKGYHLNIKAEHYWDGVREVYADIIEECFGVSVTIDKDDHTLLICSSCVQRVREASHFRIMVVSSGEQLKKLLKENSLDSVLNHEDPIKIEFIKDEDVDILETDFMDDDNLQEVNYFDTIKIKKRNKTVKKDYDILLKDFMKNSAKSLPTKTTLPKVLPKTFEKYCTALKGKANLKLIDLLESSKIKADIDKNMPQSEKSAHINNMDLLMKCSNLMPFKGKNCHGIVCYYCRRAFKDLQDLKKHVSDNHVNVNLSDLLWRHGAESIVMYVDVTDLKCTLCNEDMHTLNALRSHLIDKHKKKIYKHVTDRVVPFKLTSDRNECQLCGFNFETFGTIERHMNNHFRNYVCKECGAGFISKYRLKVHLKNSHYNGSLYLCNICKKEFFSAQKLKTHTEFVHKMTKRFKCPFCSERFNEYFKRQKHLVKEHGEAPILYKCNVCFKEFDKRYSLSKHQKKDHLEERNFQCDKCTYRCFSRHELISHMVKHGGERIYECQVCKKAFARKKTLREHMRIHLDDKRFSCAVCGQSFIQKCSLKGHMKSQHPEYDI